LLSAPPPAGPRRQVDIRRAISVAYYGLFHFTLTAADDEVVGSSQRATTRYALVYRSLDQFFVRHGLDPGMSGAAGRRTRDASCDTRSPGQARRTR
jgi:hypothetical protein